jgi:translation initiation factor 2 beta subunit (eIF-2beta)/eIF-5
MKNILPSQLTIWRMIAFISLVFFIFIALYAGTPNTSKQGVVTYVDGSVKKRTGEVTEWTPAPKNTRVVNGDKVRTYQKSRAELQLEELEIIRMAPQTTIDVIQLYEETKEKRRETKINLVEGDIWAKVNKKKGEEKFSISTPLTVSAITGTTLRLSFDEDSTTQLKVYTGEVQITNGTEIPQTTPKTIQPQQVPGPKQIPGPHQVSVEEWFYIVKSMQQITIDGQGKILNQGSFSPNDVDEKNDWIKWNIQRDRVQK